MRLTLSIWKSESKPRWVHHNPMHLSTVSEVCGVVSDSWDCSLLHRFRKSLPKIDTLYRLLGSQRRERRVHQGRKQHMMHLLKPGAEARKSKRQAFTFNVRCSMKLYAWCVRDRLKLDNRPEVRIRSVPGQVLVHDHTEERQEQRFPIPAAGWRIDSGRNAGNQARVHIVRTDAMHFEVGLSTTLIISFATQEVCRRDLS